MDAFDKLSRAFIAELDHEGIVIPKGRREDLVEMLAIQARGAAHQHQMSGFMAPLTTDDELFAALAQIREEVGRRLELARRAQDGATRSEPTSLDAGVPTDA